METHYKFYLSGGLDGSEPTPAFIVMTDGDKYGIAFSPKTDEQNIKMFRMAIGARIKASTENNKGIHPAEVLDAIPYNMMFLSANPEDEVYESWDDAVAEAERTLQAYSNISDDWKFEVFDPIYPSNDTETEE